MKQLSKTDFIHYLNCPESLWLLRNKPNEYPVGEFSLFLEKLIKEGYEVEAYAKKLFANAEDIPESKPENYTAQILQKSNKRIFYQPSFLTNKGAFARVDVLEKLPDGSFHIYEVKSSSSIKKDKKHNHLKDACFQKYVLTECGYSVSKVSIIHLSKEFVKNGEIDAHKLLEKVDVTADIELLYSATVNEINAAINFINKPIDLDGCTCLEKTRSNHCDAFNYFNQTIPEHSIYKLNRISVKKILELRDLGVLNLSDVPDNFELSEKQRLHIISLKRKQPIINQTKIEEELGKLKFPLYFIDYETYPTAVPIVEGFKPHQHLVFQVSLHTMQENGEITHYEYLANNLDLPKDMLAGMQQATNGNTGTFISWHASFEISKNKELINQVPEYKNYLEYINANTYDLEQLFFTKYADYRFLGKTSIKKRTTCISSSFKL